MAQWAVVADDLTGANTAAALLTTSSFRTLTTIDHRNIEQFPLQEYDAVVVNAASRTLDAAEAYQRVKETTEALWNDGIRHFSKRIDSTIRGNLGAETEGMLAALPPETIACVAAVFPASGRMVVGGYQIVNGVPVHKTLAGSDPVKPVHSSLLMDEFKSQTSLKQGHVPLKMISEGWQSIADTMKQQIKAGAKIIICDAISFADITAIAEAMNSLEHSWIAVDPGPLTQKACELAAADKSRVLHKKAKGKILVVAGSASDLTNSQLIYLKNQTSAKIVTVDIRPFIESDDEHPKEAIIANRIQELSHLVDVVGLKAAGYADMLIDIKLEAEKRGLTSDDITNRITHSLARIVRRVLYAGIPDLKGIYLTGGDMTVAFCQECEVKALELFGEIQPHISYGTLVGGPIDGIPIVTKGGLIGEADTIITCIKYMLSH
jgi:D-threonate/D-erythronate kinase